MVSGEHIVDLIPAYALECLDEEEEYLVAEHISGCESCRSEYEAYRKVVDELPMAVEMHDPPPGLKARVLQSVRQGEQAALPTTFWQRISGALRRASPIWGAASLVLIVALGASNLLLWQRMNRVENAGSGGLMTLTLSGTQFSPNAVGTLVLSKDGDHGTLVVDGLPVLDEAHQYQIWLVRDGNRTSGGVFSVDEFGYGAKWIHSPEPLESYTTFGVTIEPKGGSPGPTGDKVLGGEF